MQITVKVNFISVYIGFPQNQSTLNFFMRLFCLLDPFISTQIKFLATPLTDFLLLFFRINWPECICTSRFYVQT